MRSKIVGVVAASLLLSGCSTFFRGPATHAASPVTLTGAVKFDLVRLLDPSADRAEVEAGNVEAALAAFNRTVVDRNRVVGALLIASDRNCDVYLENLRGFQSAWRTAFSLTSVGLGAAGAIVTGADTARLLSGLTGAASGAQGKLDENLMGGLASEILVAGVRAGREPIRAEIVANMQKTYPDWTVEIAIADVFRYHGRCNVMSGLATAQRAVERLPAATTPAATSSTTTTTQSTTTTSGTPPTTVPRV